MAATMKIMTYFMIKEVKSSFEQKLHQDYL